MTQPASRSLHRSRSRGNHTCTSACCCCGRVCVARIATAPVSVTPVLCEEPLAGPPDFPLHSQEYTILMRTTFDHTPRPLSSARLAAAPPFCFPAASKTDAHERHGIWKPRDWTCTAASHRFRHLCSPLCAALAIDRHRGCSFRDRGDSPPAFSRRLARFVMLPAFFLRRSNTRQPRSLSRPTTDGLVGTPLRKPADTHACNPHYGRQPDSGAPRRVAAQRDAALPRLIDRVRARSLPPRASRPPFPSFPLS